MFINRKARRVAGHRLQWELNEGMAIERNTGLLRLALQPRAAGSVLPSHARRFLVASAALLVVACSSLQLGYNHADTLLSYTVDSYLDLDEAQERLARERIVQLHRWHRNAELPQLAQVLQAAQQQLKDGQLSADDVLALQQALYARVAAVGRRAAPDLAQLALMLRPEQLDRMAEKLQSDTSKARRALVRFAGKESQEDRIERYIDSAEEWLGRLSTSQRELIRDSFSSRAEAQGWWLDERERRQQALLAVLGRIQRERPEAHAATAWLHAYFDELALPSDPQRRARLLNWRRSNAELIAKLWYTATPEQRARAQKRLAGYASDLRALGSGG